MSELQNKKKNVKEVEPDHERHGNYRQYYEYRNQDSRPQHIQKCLPDCLKKLTSTSDAMDEIHMLDIGCNSGKLTHSMREVILGSAVLRSKKTKFYVLGIDIDAELLEEARAAYKSEFFEFAQTDISAVVLEKSDNPIQKYMNFKGIERFDFVSCFSILMFIHLNHGDDGLRKVLDYICMHARILILELQNWERYCEQVQRMQQAGSGEFDHFDSLEWRGSNGVLEQKIRDYVISKGFNVICTSDKKNEFNRDILIFANNEN